MPYRVELATTRDSEELKTHLVHEPISTGIGLSFRRSGNFFDFERIRADRSFVAKVLYEQVGTLHKEVIAIGGVGLHHAFLQGAEDRVAYFSDVRIARQHRKGSVLSRLFRYVRENTSSLDVELSYTAVMSGNDAATSALTTLSRRGGGERRVPRGHLPHYVPIAEVSTPCILIGKPKRQLPTPAETRVVRATQADAVALAEFLDRERSQFLCARPFPLEKILTGTLPGLALSNFLILRDERCGRIRAALGLWDLRGIRPLYLASSTMLLNIARALTRFMPRAFGLKPLPAAGEEIPIVYGCYCAAEGNDSELFAPVLRCAYNQLCASDAAFLCIGLDRRDPVSRVFEEYRRIDAGGQLYALAFDEEQEQKISRVIGSLSRVEAALL